MSVCLHNPVILVIEPIDRASTYQDPLADEPFHPISRATTVEVRAQVEELAGNERKAGAGGSEVPALAILTFSTKQLLALGYTPTDGDRVTQIKSRTGPTWTRTVNWYVKGPRGIAPGRSGRPQLITARATDGAASRNPNDGITV